MSIESPFKFLLLKKVYEILDGDKTFGKYKSRSGKSINIGLPYLSGPALCELSTIFGLPETYSQSGAQSRWMYVEKLLKYCITNGNCSRLLEHMFSLQQFQKSFAGMEKDEIESVYKDSVQKAIDGINDNLVFSNKALVYKDKKFQIIQGNRQEISSTDMLDAILDEHKTDAFSPLTEYEQCELIGKGGFGEVYRYHNKYLDMDFAVKIYRPCFMTDEEREDGEKRFFREAKILFSLNHQNIVKIYDVSRFDGNPYIKMEYLQGQTLEKIRNDNGNFDVKNAVNATIQILEGLECAHNAGIIHRDLKPSNIMVINGKGKKICKIIDFGISAFMETDGYTKLTRTGEHIAGGQYIDPILETNPKLRDIRSDIYSAASILYFLLCGRAPIGSGVKEYLEQSNDQVTIQLEDAIMKGLNINIDNRYNNCKEFIESLKRII